MGVTLKYTKEQEAELILAFQEIKALTSDDNHKHDLREDYIIKFMRRHAKTKASVISKLSKLYNEDQTKVYVARPKVSTVTGETAKTKTQIVQEYAHISGFKTNELEGLEKTPKLILVKMLKRQKELMKKSKNP